WKTANVSPAGFATDKPHIIVDAGYQTPEGEKQINIENRELVIHENVVPGFFSRAWDWIKTNLSVILGFLSAILGLVALYYGITKTRIERDESAIELELARAKKAAQPLPDPNLTSDTKPVK